MRSVVLFKSRSVLWAKMVLLAMASLIAHGDSAYADNWPQWRGAKHNGISNETGTPTKWSKTENVAWRLAMPGPGGSTPVVWGERIFLTSADKKSGDLLLLCVGGIQAAFVSNYYWNINYGWLLFKSSDGN